jgi:hypothetical protein
MTNATADGDEIEMTLVIDSVDAGLAGELGAVFPSEDVSASDNFVGGAEIAVFFTFAKDVLGKILGFVSKNRSRMKGAKVTIGRTSVSLEGYSAEDVDRLLSSPAFDHAMKAVHRR